MPWRRKRPEEDLRVISEKEIQQRLYGSYLKPEEDKGAAERESRERAEKAAEEELLKKKESEEEAARLRAELDRTKKVLVKTDGEKRVLLEKLSGALVAKEPKEPQVATRPKFRIRSTTTLFNVSPKIVIPFLVLLIVVLALFRWIHQEERRSTVTVPASTTSSTTSSTTRKELKKPYTIQICVYEKKDDAQNLVSGLKKKGYPAWLISRTSPKGRLYYNIYIGQFARLEDATKFLKELKTKEEFKEFEDSFIRKR